MKLFKVLLLLFAAVVIGAGAFVWFGVFNVAADEPHWPITHRLMETVRGRIYLLQYWAAAAAFVARRTLAALGFAGSPTSCR